MNRVEWQVCWQAALVATVTNLLPGLWENYVMLLTECDGSSNLYTSCNNMSETAPFTQTTTGGPIIGCVGLSEWHVLSKFYAMDVPVTIFWVVIELLLLGMVAVRGACAVATIFQYRLTPLNPDRAFVARALIRCAFEMGNHKSPVLAVDPTAESSTALRRLRIACMALIYTVKIIATGFLLKQSWAAALPLVVHTWLNSYAPLVASCFWDVLICAVIMEHVILLASGVATGPEVFNALLQEHDASRQPNHGVIVEKQRGNSENSEALAEGHGGRPRHATLLSVLEQKEAQELATKKARRHRLASQGGHGGGSVRFLTVANDTEDRNNDDNNINNDNSNDANSSSDAGLSVLAQLQILRAIGCAIVLKGSMHPTMELLLRHAIASFGGGRDRANCPAIITAALREPGSLDSIPLFLSDLRKLPSHEQQLVCCVMLLAQVLDGRIDQHELEVWRRIALAVAPDAATGRTSVGSSSRSSSMVSVDEDAIEGAACAFRNHEVISASLLSAALDDDKSNDHAKALGLKDSCWIRVRGVLLR